MGSSIDSRESGSANSHDSHYSRQYERLAKESALWQRRAYSVVFGGVFSFPVVFSCVLEGLRRAPRLHHQADNMQELGHVYFTCAMVWLAFTGLGVMGMVVAGGSGAEGRAASSTNYLKTLCFGAGLVMGLFYLASFLDLVNLPMGPDGAPVHLPRIVAWLFARSFLIFALWASSECSPRVLTQCLLLDWGALMSRLVAGFTIGTVRHSTSIIGVIFDIGLMYFMTVIFDSIHNASEGFPRGQDGVRRLKFIFMVSWAAFPIIDQVDRAAIISRCSIEIFMGINEFVAFALVAEAMGHGILGISSDRKMSRLQARSMELVKQLADSEKRKDRFFATMSHELRTPLNGIIGLTESILHSEAKSLTPKATGSLTTVLNTARRFGKLINTILDSAAVKEKALQLSVGPVSLHQVLEEAIGLIHPLLSSRVTLVSHIPENLPMLLADPNRLMQILYNVLGNAAKFCTVGKITVRAMQVGGSSIHIEVEDTGIGISADMLDKIFEPFEQVDNSQSRGYGGTGLGLNLALNLAKAHDGDLKVRSAPGQGTVFTIMLPIQKDGDEDVNPRPAGWTHRGPLLDSDQDLHQDDDDAKAADERDACQETMKLRNWKRRESRETVQSWMGTIKPEMSQPYMPGSHAADDDKIVPKQIELLSVDDDPVNQEVMADILGGCSYRITSAMSGAEALEILKERFERDGTASFPDLIMMDVMMPGMTGIEATQLIRGKYPMAEMPIIMVTANDDEATVHQALTEGGNDYIKKPVRRSELIARVELQLRLLKYYAKEVESRKQKQILKDILPSSVIERLSVGQTMIADKLEQVTVLFADIVGFTTMTAECSTPDIVHMLDSLFGSFDSLTDTHGVQKIETIGDCYMVVSGHEPASMDGQASRMLKFAKAMLMAAAETQSPEGKPLMIRVGIHTGPAYAGVVGQKVPRYCLFGDTVNTASRMESTGFPGCIQISNATQSLAMACPEIQSEMLFCDLGARPIKGKGAMQTWLLQEGPWEVALAANLQQMKSNSEAPPSSGNINASCEAPGEFVSLLAQKLEPIWENLETLVTGVPPSLESLNDKIETLLVLQQCGMAGSRGGSSCAISQGESAATPAQNLSSQNDPAISDGFHGDIDAWQKVSGGDLQSSGVSSTSETPKTSMSCPGSAYADRETPLRTVCSPTTGNGLGSMPCLPVTTLKANGSATPLPKGTPSTRSSGDISVESNGYLDIQGGQMDPSSDPGLYIRPDIQKRKNSQQQELPDSVVSNRQACASTGTMYPGFTRTASRFASNYDSAHGFDLAAQFGYPETRLRHGEKHPVSRRGIYSHSQSIHTPPQASPRKDKTSRRLMRVFAQQQQMQMQASQEAMLQLLSQEDEHCEEHEYDNTHFGMYE